ncbi:10643_t:CDS:2 [Cetraspora pellucida]|uniref:10643_t:CDS:1 n=1 Tax=Cetraspora pellucida TaxID=1433469 RepID=A0A9N9E3L8_9GLOM|nr:10643_t:CDS:2 [Cetraspora pellucida]
MLSGNKFIDNWLTKQNKQKVFIEFIPYEYFKNIIYLSEGGFSKIYKATCVNGIRTEWNSRKRRFAEAIINATVVLKCLNSSEAISHDFLNELKNYFQCSDGYYILQYYGITQHPETKDYMIAMAFAENGDLYNYISKNFLTISWKQKLGALRNIAWGLKTIHDKKIIHRDLHSGNILIHRDLHSGNILINNPRNVDFGVKIGDFGISKPANEITDTKEIYGNTTWDVINKLDKKEINFPENITHTHIKNRNPQAIYTSRSLNSLINTALRMKLNYNITIINTSYLFILNNNANRNNEIKTSPQNNQLSKMDLSFLCSNRILYYYQQESASPSHSNLNIPKTHQFYENNLAYNYIHNKNKRRKYNEDTHYQELQETEMQSIHSTISKNERPKKPEVTTVNISSEVITMITVNKDPETTVTNKKSKRNDL